MISGSNTSFATEAALVQISTIEQFVDEEDSYQNEFDKIITTTTFNSNSWVHSAVLGTE